MRTGERACSGCGLLRWVQPRNSAHAGREELSWPKCLPCQHQVGSQGAQHSPPAACWHGVTGAVSASAVPQEGRQAGRQAHPCPAACAALGNERLIRAVQRHHLQSRQGGSRRGGGVSRPGGWPRVGSTKDACVCAALPLHFDVPRWIVKREKTRVMCRMASPTCNEPQRVCPPCCGHASVP